MKTIPYLIAGILLCGSIQAFAQSEGTESSDRYLLHWRYSDESLAVIPINQSGYLVGRTPATPDQGLSPLEMLADKNLVATLWDTYTGNLLGERTAFPWNGTLSAVTMDNWPGETRVLDGEDYLVIANLVTSSTIVPGGTTGTIKIRRDLVIPDPTVENPLAVRMEPDPSWTEPTITLDSNQVTWPSGSPAPLTASYTGSGEKQQVVYTLYMETPITGGGGTVEEIVDQITVNIYPKSNLSLEGINETETYHDTPPLTFNYRQLYPVSLVNAVIYPEGQLENFNYLDPVSYRLPRPGQTIPTEPQDVTFKLTDWEQYIPDRDGTGNKDGVYYIQIYEETPYDDGTPRPVGPPVRFVFDTTIEVKGQIFSSE